MTYYYFKTSSTWTIIAISFILSKVSSVSSYTKYLPKAPPEIWLSSYDETDSYGGTIAETEFQTLDQFDNQLISKFNRTDYIVQNDIRVALFTCQANYPIQWTVPNLKQVENVPYFMFETLSTRMSNFSQEAKPVPENEIFQSALSVRFEYVEYFLSVNFTCGETTRSQRIFSSSIHLYFTGTHAIENLGKADRQVYVSPIKDKDSPSEFVLPCRPATPNIPILLEKRIESQNDPRGIKIKWKRFKYPTKYVTFDPKVGFIMDKNPMGKRDMIFGLYKCTALIEHEDDGDDDELISGQDKTEQQFIYVNVTFIKDPYIIDIENVHFRSNLSLKGEALVKYSQNIFHVSPISSLLNTSMQLYGDSEFVCCSGIANTRPLIFLDHCTDNLQCELLKWSMAIKLQVNTDYGLVDTSNAQNGYVEDDPKECRSLGLQSSEVVICLGQNVNFAEHLINVFSKNLWPVQDRFQKISSGKKRNKMPLSTYQPKDSKLDNLSSKIFFAVGYPITSRQLHEDNGHYYNRVQYLSFGRIYFSDIDYYDETSSRELRRRAEALTHKIAEYPRDHFYVGEPLVPLCLGWSSFYSEGAYVGITFKNGTKQTINLHREPQKTEVYFAGGLVINDWYEGWKRLVYKFGRKMVAHKDMVSLECWMPEWNTGNWDKMSRNLTILEPTPPEFREGGRDLEEYVYFVLGDDAKDLEWVVMGGIPESRIDVTKDGKSILKRVTSDLYRKDDEESKMEDLFEQLFNVTLENDYGTTVEDGSGSITVVKIRFAKKITHEMQGKYVCTAENVGGKVKRIIRVVVAEKRKIVLAILLVATILSSLILIAGMGYRLHKQKKQLQSFRATLG